MIVAHREISSPRKTRNCAGGTHLPGSDRSSDAAGTSTVVDDYRLMQGLRQPLPYYTCD